MTNDEIAEVKSKATADGATLYRVADAFYKVAIVFNWLIAIAGVILTFVAGNAAGIGGALAVLLTTAIICAICYAAAVFGSHGAKVLVHILFTNLVIIESAKK